MRTARYLGLLQRGLLCWYEFLFGEPTQHKGCAVGLRAQPLDSQVGRKAKEDIPVVASSWSLPSCPEVPDCQGCSARALKQWESEQLRDAGRVQQHDVLNGQQQLCSTNFISSILHPEWLLPALTLSLSDWHR